MSNVKIEKSEVPVIEEISGEAINKNTQKVAGYMPPTDEPIKNKRHLPILLRCGLQGTTAI